MKLKSIKTKIITMKVLKLAGKIIIKFGLVMITSSIYKEAISFLINNIDSFEILKTSLMTFIESSRIFNAPQQQKITEILSDIFHRISKENEIESKKSIERFKKSLLNLRTNDDDNNDLIKFIDVFKKPINKKSKWWVNLTAFLTESEWNDLSMQISQLI